MMATQTGSIDLKAQKEAHDKAAKVASDYITEIDSDGILVHDADYDGTTATKTGWHIGSVLEFLKAGVARFWIGLKNVGDSSPTVRIGKATGESHMELDYHSLQLIDKEGNTYFHVSDLRDVSGEATLTETFKGDGVSYSFPVRFDVSSDVSATDSSDLTNTATRSGDRNYIFTSPPANNATVTIVYKTTSGGIKAYTFGKRFDAIADIGAYSVAEGFNTSAVGDRSHAEGYRTETYGNNSHAEGWNTLTMNDDSHAEGYYSQAVAGVSHAEGWETFANGVASHTQNYHTRAVKHSQTALGTYNEEDTSSTTTHPSGTTDYGKYAAIIGNGTSNSARSNALAVRWDGVTECRNENGDWGTIFNLIYPVGAIYMSVNSTSPQTLFGGTWERITGRFLLAATDGGAAGGNSNASIAAGNTGGEASHTLTGAESGVPAHKHAMTHKHSVGVLTNTAAGTAKWGITSLGTSGVQAINTPVENYTGNTSDNTAANATNAHNNMPPYLAVYVWKRTA